MYIVQYSRKLLKGRTFINRWKVQFRRENFHGLSLVPPKNARPPKFTEKTFTSKHNSLKFSTSKFQTVRYCCVHFSALNMPVHVFPPQPVSAWLECQSVYRYVKCHTPHLLSWWLVIHVLLYKPTASCQIIALSTLGYC